MLASLHVLPVLVLMLALLALINTISQALFVTLAIHYAKLVLGRLLLTA